MSSAGLGARRELLRCPDSVGATLFMRQYFGPVLARLPEGFRIVVKPLNLLMLGSQLPLKRTMRMW